MLHFVTFSGFFAVARLIREAGFGWARFGCTSLIAALKARNLCVRGWGTATRGVSSLLIPWGL
jgi:hypothetical protein